MIADMCANAIYCDKDTYDATRTEVSFDDKPVE